MEERVEARLVSHKRKGKIVQKKVSGPVPMEGWEDPEVVRALAGVAAARC